MNRLFLFAAYDRQGIVSPALLHHIHSLAEVGDVIFVADGLLSGEGWEQLATCTNCRLAQAHGEYDFGSYKRGFAEVSRAGLLDKYDWIYLVNDSVYGPLLNLTPCLEELEMSGADATAMTYNPHHLHPHLESWFLGLAKNVFLAPWFASFLSGVEALEDKREICMRYENGLTRILLEQGCSVKGLYEVHGREIYNSAYALFRRGLPFFKKDAIIRHDGACRLDVKRILAEIPPVLRTVIEEDIKRLYGTDCLEDIRQARASAMLLRQICYSLKKVYKK